MTQIIAHAGCEQTISGSMDNILVAINAKVDIIEVDLRLYNDKIFLSHDEIKSEDSLITLEQVIELILDTDIRLNCDLKEEKAFNSVLKVLKKFNFLKRAFFTGAILPHEGEEYYYLINVEHICEIKSEKLTSENISLLLEKYKSFSENKGFLGYNFDYETLDSSSISLFKACGVKMCCWTVDKHEHLDELLLSKVDNITTNEIKYAVFARNKLNITV